MRYAVKVAYDGTRFHGSQRQGEEYGGSVEGSLVGALKEIGQYKEKDPWPVRFASRTDSGVSALGNVFTVESDMEPDDLLKALNSKMEAVWCWGCGRPRESQNIRWANSRWYRYHLLPGTVEKNGMEGLGNVLEGFKGEHDLSGFCRSDGEKNPVTFIDRAEAVDLSGNAQLIAVDIVGSRFLWQQVRRMVGAAVEVVNGKMSGEDLTGMIEGRGRKVICRTMPPTGLVLMDVHFKDIDFQVSKEAVEQAVKLSSRSVWEASIRVILDSALRGLIQ